MDVCFHKFTLLWACHNAKNIYILRIKAAGTTEFGKDI